MLVPDTLASGSCRPAAVPWQLQLGIDPLRSLRALLVQLRWATHQVPPAFLDRFRAAVRAQHIDLGALEVITGPAPRGGYPYFTYVSDGPGYVSADDQLERIASWTVDAIRVEVERCADGEAVPAAVHPWRVDPLGARDHFVATLGRLYEAVATMLIPGLVDILRREAAHWALLAATTPADSTMALFAAASPHLSVRDRRLVVDVDEVGFGGQRRIERVLSPVLVFYPVVVGPRTIEIGDPAESPDGADYVAMATPQLLLGRQRSMTRPSDALSAVLGASRAALLAHLAVRSATTTALTARSSLAPSTVSYHLAALSRAGLVDSTGRGNEVFYALTSTGAQLLDLLASRDNP